MRIWQRQYWRALRAAMQRAEAQAGEGATLTQIYLNLDKGWKLEAVILNAEACALDGCTPCREWLTALAREGRDDVKRWLVDNELCTPQSFVGWSR